MLATNASRTRAILASQRCCMRVCVARRTGKTCRILEVGSGVTVTKTGIVRDAAHTVAHAMDDHSIGSLDGVYIILAVYDGYDRPSRLAYWAYSLNSLDAMRETSGGLLLDDGLLQIGGTVEMSPPTLAMRANGISPITYTIDLHTASNPALDHIAPALPNALHLNPEAKIYALDFAPPYTEHFIIHEVERYEVDTGRDLIELPDTPLHAGGSGSPLLLVYPNGEVRVVAIGSYVPRGREQESTPSFWRFALGGPNPLKRFLQLTPAPPLLLLALLAPRP